MDKVAEVSLLLDFYGSLLTEKQYEVLDLHYNNDYSLAEIGELSGISRQGVHDNLKRGRMTLDKLEESLGLVKRHMQQQAMMKDIQAEIGKLCVYTSQQQADSELVSSIREGLDRIRTDMDRLIDMGAGSGMDGNQDIVD